ncbi:hypothetical protein HPB51_025615 [Rhipicephalus microplus]|uniref:Uncharacterized protein n=1 Tax=Rhipicephalus microplus TaxID=6941 RepID=A0A9J6D7T4_RHIMP|nr:hypothetical protein HPB51_025615 [Rhipicephalus microplus]
MGIHNSWQELTEAQRTSQLERLKLTSTGRSVLERLGSSESYIYEADRKEKMPPYMRESFSITQSANELSQNPGLTAAPQSSTPAPLIRWPSRRPHHQVFYADNASDFGEDESQPNRGKATSGEYELRPDGHRPYRRQEPGGLGESSTPPEVKDYGDEIDRWRENYWKNRRYAYTDDNVDDMHDAGIDQHHKSGRPPSRQQNRRQTTESPDSEEANGSGEEARKNQPYRRRDPSRNAADHDRRGAPREKYDADQSDVLNSSHRKKRRGPQGDHDADEREASVRKFGKRTRGPTRDDKDEQGAVPINGRKKNVRPQGGYNAEPGDVMGKNRRTRTKTKGLPENYEEDQERDSVVGRRRRTRRPQGGYGASLGEGLDNSQRKKAREPLQDYDADQKVPDSVRRRTRGPLGNYNIKKESNPNSSNPRKRRRPLEDYEEDQGDVLADDYNRKTIGPREKYNNNGEEALEKSYGKWRESAQDYDADPDSVPDNWRGGRAGGPQTSYDSDQTEKSVAQKSDIFAGDIADTVPRQKRARRRRKNDNNMGDTLLDTTRAKEAVRQQTTPSGLEEFINFDDDDFTGQAEPSGTSGTSSEQRTERGLGSLVSPFGLIVQAATVKSIGDIFRESGFREDFAGAARMNKFALAFRIVNNIVCGGEKEDFHLRGEDSSYRQECVYRYRAKTRGNSCVREADVFTAKKFGAWRAAN